MKKNNKSYYKHILRYILREVKEQDEDYHLQRRLDSKKKERTFKDFFVINYYLDRHQNTFDPDIAYKDFLRQTQRKPRRATYLISTAAVLTVIVLALVLFQPSEVPTTNDQIVLQLSDGSYEVLGTSGNATQQITENGQLVGIQDQDTLVMAPVLSHKTDQNVALRTLHVPNGKRYTISLQDGSYVVMNSGSSLQFPTQFSDTLRTVFLRGEAFFTVAKDSEVPFIVQTEEVAIKVYGTQFNVNAYDDENTIQIVLTEGSIGLNPTHKDATTQEQKMVPNQLATIDTHSHHMEITATDPSYYTQWKDGVLQFRNEKFIHIAKRLERFYDVDINIKDSQLLEERFTGRFDVENIQSVLQTFRQVMPFRYVQKEKSIWIMGEEL